MLTYWIAPSPSIVKSMARIINGDVGISFSPIFFRNTPKMSATNGVALDAKVDQIRGLQTVSTTDLAKLPAQIS